MTGFRTLRVLRCLMICASFVPVVAVAADDGLLAGIPAPAGSKSLGGGGIDSGGEKASYSTSAAPAAVIEAYQQPLAAAGWTVVSSGGSGSSYGGGAGLQATNGPKYLSINAGGPAGTTFVHVCVWPEKPKDDNCG